MFCESPKINFMPLPHDKDWIEFLTNELIKLQKVYDNTAGTTPRAEIGKAMRVINDALEMSLKPRIIAVEKR